MNFFRNCNICYLRCNTWMGCISSCLMFINWAIGKLWYVITTTIFHYIKESEWLRLRMHSNNKTGKKLGQKGTGEFANYRRKKNNNGRPAGPDTPLLEAGGCVVVLLWHAARSPEWLDTITEELRLGTVRPLLLRLVTRPRLTSPRNTVPHFLHGY